MGDRVPVRYCTSCGSELPGTAQFCASCGAAQADTTLTPSSSGDADSGSATADLAALPESSNRTTPKLLIGAAILVALISIVAVALALASGGDAGDVAAVPEPAGLEQAGDSGQSPSGSAPADSVSAEAFDLRFEVHDVIAEWYNEKATVFTGSVTVDNVSLDKAVDLKIGWIWMCPDTRIDNEAVFDGLHATIAAESYPEPGFGTELTSPVGLEPLTAIVLPLPMTLVPTDRQDPSGATCDEFEMHLVIKMSNPSDDVEDRRPEPDGARVTNSDFDLVSIPIGTRSIQRSAGPFDTPPNLALADVCDELVAQDLEALYGVPVSNWSEDPDGNDAYCQVAGSEIWVSNSPSYTAHVEEVLASTHPAKPLDGSSTVLVDAGAEPGFGYVRTMGPGIIYSDTELGHAKLATLGRLLERIALRLLAE